MSNLHDDIMNIQSNHSDVAYKQGHRDARHAAAQLALEYDIKMKILQKKLEDSERLIDIINGIN